MSAIERRMNHFTLHTDYPIATESRDHHVFDDGKVSFVNNSRSTDFNQQLQDLLKHTLEPSVLDIGCAGGGMVHDVLEMGIDAVGLEGSDFCKRNKLKEWPLIPENLFTCDVTKPFVLSSENGPHPFDVITAWEVFEHIPEEDLPQLMRNLNTHSKTGTGLVCSIANFPSPVLGVELHRTIKESKWWETLFAAYDWRRDKELERHFDGHRVRTGSYNFAMRR